MANYQTLKAAINAVIKANGNKEITGTVLNEVLLAMVNSLGAGYQFAGVATPSTNPGTPDQKVFYIASQAGTYTNFGGAVVSDGIAIFEWNGSWSANIVFVVDDEPTAGSDNMVKSGGIYDIIYGNAYKKNSLSNVGFVRYTTGVLTPGGYNTSNFISVNEGTVIKITDYCSSSVALISAYSDANESNYLQNLSIAGSNNAGQEITYTVPSGVSYIRMSCSADHLDAFIAKTQNSGIDGQINDLSGQINDLSEQESHIEADVCELKDTVYGGEQLEEDDLENEGFVRYTTGVLTPGGYHTSNFVKVNTGDAIKLTDYCSPSVALISAYSQNSESSYIQSSSVPGNDVPGREVSYTVPSGVNYVRISCAMDYLVLFTAKIGEYGLEEKIKQLTPCAINFMQPSFLLKKNRVSVNFAFDDGSINDKLIKEVFDEFNYKCGFAIMGSDKKYFDYATQGFEILAHNSGALYDKTETEIRASMVQGKNYVESLGLICHGWVTPSSALPVNLAYVTNDYFEYGFTIYKGDSTTGQTMTKDIKSYNLWRVHMNTLLTDYQNIFADAIQNNGMISVYAHGHELGQEGMWTLNDLRTIIQYCKDNLIEVLTPYQSCLKLFGEKHNEN